MLFEEFFIFGRYQKFIYYQWQSHCLNRHTSLLSNLSSIFYHQHHISCYSLTRLLMHSLTISICANWKIFILDHQNLRSRVCTFHEVVCAHCAIFRKRKWKDFSNDAKKSSLECLGKSCNRIMPFSYRQKNDINFKSVCFIKGFNKVEEGSGV